MPNRGIAGTMPAKPAALSGVGKPAPCTSEIFSSNVMRATRAAARRSGDRAGVEPVRVAFLAEAAAVAIEEMTATTATNAVRATVARYGRFPIRVMDGLLCGAGRRVAWRGSGNGSSALGDAR